MSKSTLILPDSYLRDMESKHSAARELVRESVRKISARYDAAQTTSDNTRHWAMADGMSANAANNPAVRRTLRNRARYEMANNTYCKGMVQTVANNTVGKGPRLQLRTGDKALDKKLMKAFAKWAKQVKFAQKLRTMVRGRVGDGESFANLTTNMNLKSKVKLDFKPFEPEICTTESRVLPIGKTQVDGIDFDRFDDPEFYWELPYHPGDTVFTGLNAQPVKYLAKNVIHLYKEERAGQKRGVPEITPALPLFAQLRRYTLAVIAAAEIAALISVFLKTTGSAVPPDVLTAWAEFDLARNAGMVMPDGWDMQQFKPEQPVTTYAEFKNEILNEIARCLDMPFNIAACNSSGYNYSSGKLDHKTYGESIEIDRSDLETIVLDRLWFAWLEEAKLIPDLIPEGADVDEWDHKWFWDESPSADPLKDANAQDVKLRNGSAFLSDEWETQGRDFEEELEQEAARFKIDVDEMRQIVLKTLYSGAAVEQNPEEPDETPPGKQQKPTPNKKGKANAQTGA